MRTRYPQCIACLHIFFCTLAFAAPNAAAAPEMVGKHLSDCSEKHRETSRRTKKSVNLEI